MRSHLQHGMSAAEAAPHLTWRSGGGTRDDDEAAVRARARSFAGRWTTFDEAPRKALDSVLAEFSTETVLTDLVLPYLHELGERWASGEASVGQEHFASQLIRGRLLGLARGWDRGAGPRALLACAPGEQHDLGLIAFGVALRARGWRITYLGQDTPLETLAECPLAWAARDRDHPFRPTGSRGRAELRRLAGIAHVWLAGPGAEALAKKTRATFLDVDPVAAADRVAATRP